MSVRQIVKDEKFSTSAKVDGKKVRAIFACKQNETTGTRYAVTSTLDFNGVSAEDILTLATRSVIIDLQRQWRVKANVDLKTATNPQFMSNVDVQKQVVESAPRKSAEPVSTAKSKFMKLSHAEQVAFLAEMNARVAPTTKAA